MRRIFAVSLVPFLAIEAQAGEDVTLKAAAGGDVVANYCGACHSLDYPRMNALFLDRQSWEAEVDKMIKAYGAPIGPADAKVIVDYLTANYGDGR